jgi:glutaredoxin
MVKEFLSEHKLSYKELDVSVDTKARDEMVFTHESMSTPTIVIGNKVLRGLNDETVTELEKLVQK